MQSPQIDAKMLFNWGKKSLFTRTTTFDKKNGRKMATASIGT